MSLEAAKVSIPQATDGPSRIDRLCTSIADSMKARMTRLAVDSRSFMATSWFLLAFFRIRRYDETAFSDRPRHGMRRL